MLLISLATLALVTPSTSVPPIAPAPGSIETIAVSEDHGKLNWFQGSFEDALKEAKAKNKIVFVDFWTTWCGWCKRLDKDTYTDDAVAAEMKDIICFNIDAESKEGAPLAKKFNVKGYPALILLNPDGTYRDQIGGYLKPDQFIREIRRVRSGKGTLDGLRQEVENDKTSIEKRFAYATKLKEMEDKAGADAQMAEIKKLDPAGKSQPMHQIAFEELIATINDGWQKSRALDMASMKTFLEKETYPEILFQGWNSMAGMQNYLAQMADKDQKPDEAKKLQADFHQSMALAWKNCPEAQMSGFGRKVAGTFYDDGETLTPAEKTLALEIARKVHSLEPDDAGANDLLACCLFMNGQKDEALKANARCIELDPKNPDWPSRKTEFSAPK